MRRPPLTGPHRPWAAPDGSARPAHPPPPGGDAAPSPGDAALSPSVGSGAAAPGNAAPSGGPAGAVHDPLAVFVPPGARVRKPWSPRRKRLFAAIPLGALLLGGIAQAGWFGWSLTRYTVVERDGAVLVEHGAGPVRRAEPTGVDPRLLPPERRRALANGIEAGGRAAADAQVAHLRSTADGCRADPTPPCPMGTLRAAVLHVVHEYPHPTRIRITWDDLDRRPGVRVTLRVNGTAPPAPCPTVLERPGSCVFDGELETEYRATAESSGPAGTTPVVAEAFAITDDAPFMAVERGYPYRIKDSRGRFRVVCDLMLETGGLETDRTYRATVRRPDHAPIDVSFTTSDGGVFGYGTGDPIATFPDAGPGAWVQVKIKGTDLVSKRLPWRCRE